MNLVPFLSASFPIAATYNVSFGLMGLKNEEIFEFWKFSISMYNENQKRKIHLLRV